MCKPSSYQHPLDAQLCPAGFHGHIPLIYQANCSATLQLPGASVTDSINMGPLPKNRRSRLDPNWTYACDPNRSDQHLKPQALIDQSKTQLPTHKGSVSGNRLGGPSLHPNWKDPLPLCPAPTSLPGGSSSVTSTPD